MQLSTTRAGISVREAGTLNPEEKLFEVLDNERQERFLLVIRRVNGTLLSRRVARQVVRFSKREHSPNLSPEIRVSTLTRYREGENLEDGQCDPMEGRVKLDAMPYFARSLSEAGFDGVRVRAAEAVLALATDPWVFCTAFCPSSERDAYRLARRICSDYDTITDILDVNAFALELGVIFAVTLDSAIHTKANSAWHLIQRASVAGSEFANVVRVDHGPVAYEDVSGQLDTGIEPVELASRAGFIKPTSRSYESEYRFALRAIGEPSIRTLPIPVSDELRACTSLR